MSLNYMILLDDVLVYVHSMQLFVRDRSEILMIMHPVYVFCSVEQIICERNDEVCLKWVLKCCSFSFVRGTCYKITVQ